MGCTATSHQGAVLQCLHQGEINVFQTLTAVSIPEPMTCAGCGEQVCDRFFLLAAGRVWHSVCLRCSQCDGELQTHPSLYWRDGNIYCLRDYCRSALLL